MLSHCSLDAVVNENCAGLLLPQPSRVWRSMSATEQNCRRWLAVTSTYRGSSQAAGALSARSAVHADCSRCVRHRWQVQTALHFG